MALQATPDLLKIEMGPTTRGRISPLIRHGGLVLTRLRLVRRKLLEKTITGMDPTTPTLRPSILTAAAGPGMKNLSILRRTSSRK